MSVAPYSSVDPALYPHGIPAGSGTSAMSWSAILAGAVGAIAITLTLLALGSAFGLASISPWPGLGAKASTFAIGTGIWLIVTQWVSALTGGYLAGRLRTRWTGLHTDEVFFRDTAHGFLTWATATFILAIVAVVAGALMDSAAPDTTVVVTREAADAARKVGAAFAGFTALSLILGAFIASAAGAVGGRLRDMHP
ncbi:hypothetical protein WBP06_04135 [Novosphingobium sp. BL-8H]|uniref:hypothetical protein n=1 Tax=Novosphingobium sp. BL-8H TaxID=3127640 RepID=UPI0037569786